MTMMMTDLDWKAMEFDEEKWENMINSDDLFTENFPSSFEHSDDDDHHLLSKKDLLKVSLKHMQRIIFGHTEKFLRTNRTMSILTSPSAQQRVRYENECKHILRYISIPNNGILTIQIPDLRHILDRNDVLWLRITRTTINHRNDQFVFFHPYPLWIRNSRGKIHHGSIYLPIEESDLERGFLQIHTLAMIRLKQEELKQFKTLSIYSPMKLNVSEQHDIESKTAKQIRDIYRLRQSILNFQVVRVDQENIAYPTDCFCQTGILQEFEANIPRKKLNQRHRIKTKKSKQISQRKQC